MKDFTISFERPLLMLLLIPALALTLLTYFLINKKYRRTRNRIVSMVLHMIVMTLCICVVSGLKFDYVIPNEENEILLLVDVSDTAGESKEAREEFMRTVISESRYDGYKVGVVTFGFTQEYAVPLTYDTESIFERYEKAPLPDTSATDIAAALRYANGLFEHRESAKIVLISDGKETDEKAATVIRSVSAQGTKVDTVCISSEYGADNLQVVGVEFPTYHININEECDIGVAINSKNGARSAVIELYDNGDFDSDTGLQTVDVSAGTQVVNFRMSFDTEGLHEICVKVSDSDDELKENNSYYSYLYLEVYDQVLVIDRGKAEGESDEIENLLEQGDGEHIRYEVTPLHLLSGQNIPSTVEDLLKYDQIVLNNIAGSDLTPYGLDELLYSYVYDYGGGLFTVGGNDEEGNAHAYNRFDLRNTLLQQMLPVQAINYTPPVGVAIVIDVSGSMSSDDKLEWAKSGAITCLDALTERDYVGVFSLESTYHTEMQLTSRTEETTIKEAINRLTIGGSTQYTPAIIRAGQALIAEQRVDRRHIIIITDGMPTDKREDYIPEVERFFKNNGITFSAVGIGMSEGEKSAETLNEIVSLGHGRQYKEGEYGEGIYFADSEHDLLSALIKDLNASEIKELEEEDFHPVVADKFSPVVSGVEYGKVEDKDEAGNVIKTTADALSLSLGGFYGVKARERAETILVGEYEVPLYAQWKFGQGMVGSFMCDLSGNWSKDLLTDKNGQKLLLNIISNLMPTSNIRPNEIRIQLEEDNYFNNLSILTDLEEGQHLEGSITEYTDDGELVTSLNTKTQDTEGAGLYVTVDLNAENRYTRSVFILKRGGTYKIAVNKVDEEGNILGTAEIYKSFSYSEEYSGLAEFDPEALMAELASKGNGEAVAADDPWSVFRDFVTGIEKTADPTPVFLILSAVLFLLDIAVRKFKFKWPHELVRSYKERKAAKK